MIGPQYADTHKIVLSQATLYQFLFCFMLGVIIIYRYSVFNSNLKCEFCCALLKKCWSNTRLFKTLSVLERKMSIFICNPLNTRVYEEFQTINWVNLASDHEIDLLSNLTPFSDGESPKWHLVPFLGPKFRYVSGKLRNKFL